MRFEVVRDPSKVAKLREAVGEAWQRRHDARGRLVAHSMPALPQICPQLMSTIFGSAHREQYMGVFYYVESKDRHVRHLTPAAQYYVSALQAMADDRYSLSASIARTAALLGSIQNQWRRTKHEYGPNKQPIFSVEEHVFQLKTEIAAALFFARGLLDVFATLSHFLYSPTSRVFSSFTDWLKHLAKPRTTEPCDETMRTYCGAHMQWYWYLRDFRDYVTHHSSLDIAFYEQNGKLEVYLQHLVRPQDLLRDISNGVDSFLSFADSHYSARFVRRA
jgi:hypothetical protein